MFWVSELSQSVHRPVPAKSPRNVISFETPRPSREPLCRRRRCRPEHLLDANEQRSRPIPHLPAPARPGTQPEDRDHARTAEDGRTRKRIWAPALPCGTGEGDECPGSREIRSAFPRMSVRALFPALVRFSSFSSRSNRQNWAIYKYVKAVRDAAFAIY